MSEAKTKKLVERLRLVNDEGDPDLDGEEILSKIRKLRDPAAFRLLLLMRASDDQWGTDEREEVINTLVNFPKQMYAAEIGKLSAELAQSSPGLFGCLVPTIIGQDVIETYLANLPPLTPEAGRTLLANIQQFDDDPAEVQAKTQRLRDGITKRAAE